jgi:hypothetical protein
MKRFPHLIALLLTALLALSITGPAQTSKKPPGVPVRKSPLEPYAGVWTSSLEGKTWLTLRLSLQATRLLGSIERPLQLQFNNDGEVKSVSDEQITEVVEDAQINPDGLLLTVKNPESHETNRFTMRLTSPTTAELKMSAMAMPAGMPKTKPWKLSRSGAPGEAAQ